ncbi:hypothetical protein DL93DRAFT_2078039 [Clavulina sp. PMI_390]|nr:hypothetical protein DL93DRAFT_2078039 [Clavulina sp. PMI_390]
MGKFNAPAFTSSIVKAVLITVAAFKYGARVPRSMRMFLFFLLALNRHSFPLAWHYEILGPWFKALWGWRLVYRIKGPKAYNTRLRNTSYLGKSPFDKEVVYICKKHAHITDCDYNTHLSNSSYAKNLDQARMEGIIKILDGMNQSGVQCALGGGYFHFMKEIPMHVDYEVHWFISGWDDKWMYFSTAFITRPKAGKKGQKNSKDGHLIQDASKQLMKGQNNERPPTEVGDSTVATTLPSPSASGTATPSTNPTMAGSTTLPDSQIKAGLSYSAIEPLTHRLPEGAVLHATALSVYCFKSGRVTVPPRIGLILSGFGRPSTIPVSKDPAFPLFTPTETHSAKWDAYSRWGALTSLRLPHEGKNRNMVNILRGGWKDANGGNDKLGEGFWNLEELESEGQRRAVELRRSRDVMDSLAGR